MDGNEIEDTNINVDPSGNDSETLPDIEWEVENGVEDANVENVQTSLRYEFRDETWNESNFTYSPMPMQFRGRTSGPSTNYRAIPSFRTLIALFWTPAILSSIVLETNRYAK